MCDTAHSVGSEALEHDQMPEFGDVLGDALPRIFSGAKRSSSSPKGGSREGTTNLSMLRQRIIVHLLRQVPMAPSKLFSTCAQLLECGVLTYDVFSEMTGSCSKNMLPQLTDKEMHGKEGVFEIPRTIIPQKGEGVAASREGSGAEANMAAAKASAAAVSEAAASQGGNCTLGSLSRFEQDFERLELLGRGAFGEVWRCRHRLDRCEYAVKMVKYHTSLRDAAEVERKVLREVQTWSSLNHPNVVRYHNAWVEVDWTTLSRDLEHSTQLPPLPARRANVSKTDRGSPSFYVGVEENEYSDYSVNYSDYEATDGGDGGVVFLDLDNTSDGKDVGKATSQVQDLNVVPRRNGRQNEIVELEHKLHYQATLYIQTELCSQDTLMGWIHQRNAAIASGRTSPEDLRILAAQAVTIFHQVVSALARIHELKIVHRDLKPSNILFAQDGSIRIGDFGLAKSLALDGSLSIEDQCVQTPSGNMSSGLTRGVGTPSYSSPEQLANTKYGVETDIHALGIVLAEMLCPAGTQMERAVLIEGLRRGHGVPAETAATFPTISRLVVDMTNPDPSRRPTAKQLLEAHADVVTEMQQAFCKIQQPEEEVSAEGNRREGSHRDLADNTKEQL
eukprot:TRINITY_DN32039_c0_g1_i1.p1 TRINITY_DN32039_c0_g1~~TRINITY_DN32039_c0_g1_i1.p1  ORF type:complete len:618 (-),score=125.99 TRINITY_DN32039_c0_g1_i1:117-1970(-)